MSGAGLLTAPPMFGAGLLTASFLKTCGRAKWHGQETGHNSDRAKWHGQETGHNSDLAKSHGQETGHNSERIDTIAGAQHASALAFDAPVSVRRPSCGCVFGASI